VAVQALVVRHQRVGEPQLLLGQEDAVVVFSQEAEDFLLLEDTLLGCPYMARQRLELAQLGLAFLEFLVEEVVASVDSCAMLVEELEAVLLVPCRKTQEPVMM
jgi:hypothetical protein